MSDLISLIVCTLGRKEPLARLLASLERQDNRSFEVVIVDQNEGEYLRPIIERFGSTLAIRHLRSPKGLSRARNVGLRHCKGHIVGFPDDDCWYGPRVTAQIDAFFARPGTAVLCGRTLDVEGRESVSAHRGASGAIDRHNVFASGNSNTLFARTQIARDVGGFDEALGVGALTPFQSGEETDFLLRCLRSGNAAYYERDFIVHHDQNNEVVTVRIARARVYSAGFGRLLRIHDYGLSYLGARIGRAFLRGTVCLATGDVDGARQRYGWAVGCMRGYMAGQ